MSNVNDLQKELDDLKISVTKSINELREKYFVSPDGVLLLQSKHDSEFVIGFSIDLGLLKNQD